MGLVLDGWLFPIRDEDVAENVKQPVLFINTGNLVLGSSSCLGS
jgi:hypothetical protein